MLKSPIASRRPNGSLPQILNLLPPTAQPTFERESAGPPIVGDGTDRPVSPGARTGSKDAHAGQIRSAALGRGGSRLQADLRSGLERGLGLLERTHLAVVAVMIAQMFAMMLGHLGIGIQRGGLGLSRFIRQRRSQAIPATPAAAIQLKRLTYDSKAFGPAVSPSGEFVAYRFHEGDKDSLMLKNIANGSTIQIMPPIVGFSGKHRRCENGSCKQGGGNCFQHGRLLFEGDLEVTGRSAGLVDHADDVRELALNAP